MVPCGSGLQAPSGGGEKVPSDRAVEGEDLVEGRGALTRPYRPVLSPTTGSLNLLVRSRNKGGVDTHAWSLSGNKGNVWQQAHVPIHPGGPFQVSPLGLGGRTGWEPLGRPPASFWEPGEENAAEYRGLPGR